MEENDLGNKKSSKELWLLLIFIDLIALCVFSYLIYSSFANNNNKEIKINRDVKTEEVVLEEIDLSNSAKKEPKKEEKEIKQEPKQEPAKEIKKQEVSEVKDQPKEEAKPLPQKEPKEVQTPTTETKNDVKKESIKVSGTGKWRQVTFKYFDTAKSVAIVSGFTSTKPRDLKKVNGVWEITLTISPGTYRYMFVVDGKETKDPYNNQESNGRSLIVIK
ncbi:MAG: hypothetical protein II183_01890 [Elusimicrobiaceae bacterium]|nr:hypothetical protein [Elusimicrobiaceae bacterium]